MKLLLVSSPGRERTVLHWSHAMAATMAGAAAAGGAQVRWFAVLPAGSPALVAPSGVALEVLPFAGSGRHHRIAADTTHPGVDAALTAVLRQEPTTRVVHVGVGARGSPNLCWLASRLGSPTFAVVRAAEVECHRGDLVQADGEACTRSDDPERCRRCCAPSVWRRPHADAFRNRADLLVASLQATEATFVPTSEDQQRLVAFGVPMATLVVNTDVAGMLSRCLPR